MNENIFGENIKRARIKQGLTQKQLAVILHVSHQCISKWEKGTVSPQVMWVYKIAKELKVKPADLLNSPNSRI